MLDVCVLVCVSTWTFHFLALNPLKQFCLDFFFFCARKHFGLFLLFVLFHLVKLELELNKVATILANSWNW